MKILYIHQYFKVPEEGGGIRSYHLARNLVNNGHEVEMITAHNSQYYERTELCGITVHYLPIYYDNNLGYFRRILAFLNFVVGSIRLSGKIKDVDVSYVMTTPLTTGFIAIYNKIFRRIPYIFEVGDLWPDVPIAMGVVKNKFFKFALYRMEKLFYQNAKGLVGLSLDITTNLVDKVPGKPIVTIPNMADCTFFDDPEPLPSAFVFSHQNPFIVTYAGTLGIANHLEYLLDAASHCCDLPVKFQIIGEGKRRKELLEKCQLEGLANVEFYDPVDKAEIKEFLSNSHSVYISFAQVPIISTGSPNKLFDGFAAGKMIIINFEGWIKELIEENNLGFSYNPSQPLTFKEKLLEYIQSPTKLYQCQIASKEIGKRQFDVDILCTKQLDFIEQLQSH